MAPFLANPVGRDADAAAGDQYCSNLLCNGRVFNRLAWINPVRAGSLGLDSSKLAKKQRLNQFQYVYLDDVASSSVKVNRAETNRLNLLS